MMHNAVSDQDIQRIVDGFIDFFRQNVNNPQFEFSELKDFMEPIFRKTGYRSTQSRKKFRQHSDPARGRSRRFHLHLCRNPRDQTHLPCRAHHSDCPIGIEKSRRVLSLHR